MRSASTVMPSTRRDRAVLQVVEQDRRVGQDDPLDRGVRDVALVPERDVLEAGLGVAAQHAREAGDLLGLDRVALVRHRRGALLARRGTAPGPRAPRCAAGGGPRSRTARGRRRPARSRSAARRGGRGRRPASRRPRARARAARARAPRSPGRSRRRCRPLPRARRPRRARSARRRRSALRSASKAKPASLTPKVVGSAWTPWVRPTQSVPACSRARAASVATSSSAPARTTSPAAFSCSASAVSRTSEEVRPKWIQRPAGPAEAASTSTNAAMSWSVTFSRSLTASTVNVAARIASSSSSVGPAVAEQRRQLLAGGDLDPAPALHARLVGPEARRGPDGCSGGSRYYRAAAAQAPRILAARRPRCARCRGRRRRPARRAASARSRGSRRARPRRSAAPTAARRSPAARCGRRRRPAARRRCRRRR